jgi:diguanylate cyclase (GGDEF)-like protein
MRSYRAFRPGRLEAISLAVAGRLSGLLDTLRLVGLAWLALALILAAPATQVRAASNADNAQIVTPVPAEAWLQRYRTLATKAPASCPPVSIPAIDDHAPKRAFLLEPSTAQQASEPLVATLKDPIAERFIVLAQDDSGCIRVGESGRVVPFNQRSILSPFPNSRLPLNFGSTPPIAIVIDHKAIRPWVDVLPESLLQCLSERIWIALGMLAGILATLFVIAILMTRYQRSALTLAYLGYIAALLFYQLQAMGLGAAWLSSWPAPNGHHLLQAIALGSVVIGMSLPVIAFLRPCGGLRRLLLISVALSAGGFYLSAQIIEAYRFGAAVLPLLAVVVILLLARRLRDGEPGVRWFAGGLAAALLGGGIQALSVVTQGAWLPAISAFAFPIGNLFESTCWLIAIALRLRADHLSLQRQLIYEAHHDSLTGSHSRSYMRTRILGAITNAKRTRGSSSGLLYIDLGGFKGINDRFGQAVGDEVLRAVSAILQNLGLNADSIGRYGGDEFIILMRQDLHWSHTEGAAATILGRFQEPIELDEMAVLIRPDIGIVRISAEYPGVDEVIQDANRALQITKQLGGRHATLFEPQMRNRANTQQALHDALEEAIRNRKLDLHFQPMVALDSMLPVGFEALLRSPLLREKGIGVDQLFAVAEPAGMLTNIGEHVVELALAQISAWQRQGAWSAGLFLSINVCQRQLIDGRFLAHLHRALQAHAIDPSTIRLELSEGSLGTDLDWSTQVLPRLLNQHLLIGIDNFGAGLASLKVLTELEPDYIKVDRRLIAALATLPRAQNLARAARQFATDAGMLAIAEGIETKTQLESLRELGFEYGQGRLIASPMSGAETASWLQLVARAHDQSQGDDAWQRQLH